MYGIQHEKPHKYCSVVSLNNNAAWGQLAMLTDIQKAKKIIPSHFVALQAEMNTHTTAFTQCNV